MKYKNATSFLALTLAAAVPVFADGISSHSGGGSKFVTFSEGFTSSQNLQGASAECNFLLGASREKGRLSASTIAGASSGEAATGEKSSIFAGGAASSENFVSLVNFARNNGVSSDKDKGEGKGKGKQGGGSGNGKGTTSGSGAPSPLIAVAEPGSQSLLLFGLAGLGMLVSRRKTFANAI